MLAAEIDALAEEEERLEAMAKERAEKEAKAKAEFKSRASQSTRAAIAAKRKVRRQVLARAMESARMQALEQAATALMEEPKPAVEPVVEIPLSIEPVEVAEPAPLAVVDETPVPPETKPAIEPAKPVSRKRHSILTGRRVWYYTSEGERVGPVAFEELKEMAENSALNPRLDLVWKKGAAEWLPAGKIDGLFQRPAAEKATPASVSHKPAATLTKFRVKPPGQDAFWPGAPRRSLLVVALVLPFVWNAAWRASKPALSGKFGTILMDRMAWFAAWVPLFLILLFAWKRLLNLGMNRWWSLALLAPVLNLWVGYRCFACPRGYAVHRRMDAAGVLLGLVYWVGVIAVLSSLSGLSGPWSAWVEPTGLKTQLARAIQSVHSLAFR